MVVVSILPHAEFGPNDHREDAPLFRCLAILLTSNIVSQKYPIKVNNFDIGTDENGELNVKIKVNDLTPEVQNLLNQV